MVHPNSLANLRPPWQPGTQPKPGAVYIERMINRGNQLGPQAMTLLGRAMKDPDQPMSLRIRCAEYIVDKTWPKDPGVVEQWNAATGSREFHVIFIRPGEDARDITAKPNGGAFSVSFDADGE